MSRVMMQSELCVCLS